MVSAPAAITRSLRRLLASSSGSGGAAACAAAAAPSNARGFAVAAGAAAQLRGPLLEIREYTLHPAGIKEYLQLTAANAELRRRLLPFAG